jgi:hypothetical protein
MSVIRKIYTVSEDTERELGRPVRYPTRRMAAAAVIENPWAGRGFVRDIVEDAAVVAAKLAPELTARLIDALGGTERIEAFGKAAIVGLDGEIEHGAALIHTPYFGNLFRELVDGTSILAFSDDLGPGGTGLPVPMWHKTASSTRSHYQTVRLHIPDAPRANEIVVIAAASTGARPNARIGDRTTDPTVTLSDVEHS